MPEQQLHRTAGPEMGRVVEPAGEQEVVLLEPRLFDPRLQAIAAWPRAEEGWDGALPELVGTADPDLGVYWIKNITAAMMYFTRRSATVRAS